MSGSELPAPGTSVSSMETLLDALRKELFSIPTEIEKRVTEPLDAAVRHAAEMHATLIEPIESESNAGRKIEPIELARYRASAVSEVSKHICDTVSKLEAGDTVGSIFVDRIQRLRRIVTDAPEDARTEVELSSDSPQSERSARRRVRKVWLRLVRRFRSWRKAAPLERDASLRQILEFELNQQLADDMLPVYETVQQSIAQRFAALERDMTDWSFEVLELDDDFGLHDLVAQQNDTKSSDSDSETASEPDDSHTPNVERINDAVARMATQDTDPLIETISAELELVLAELATELPSVLQAASTPILRSARRVLPLVDDPEPVSWKNRRELWNRWHAQVSNRLRLNHSMLTFRDELARMATTTLCEIRAATLQPVLDAFDAAQDWFDEAGPKLEAAFDGDVSADVNKLVEIIEAVDRESEAELKRLFQDSILRAAQTALTDPGAARWQELTTVVDKLPDDLPLHSHRYEQGTTIDPRARAFSVDLREIATSALAPDWPSLLAETAEPLKAGITRSFVGAEKLQNVINFNLGAAINELLEPSEPTATSGVSSDQPDSASASSPTDTARGLAVDALRRSRELVVDLEQSLDQPWLEFAREFDVAVYDDWHDMVSQVQSDDMMSERWIGMRTRALRNVERFTGKTLSLWEKGVARARHRGNALRRLATRLIRHGRTAVGLDETTEEDESTIADGLRSAEDVRESLPLVYRRLFAIGDVADLSLLQGRGRDLVSVRRKLERWKKGRGLGTLVLTGTIGSGRTSFLEALQVKVLSGCAVHLFEVEERSTASDRLIAEIAESLALSRETQSFSDIEAQLREREVSEAPTVLLLDNIEHLMLQTAGGTATLQELLNLMVRTDHAVFWLATMSTEAWRYFEKVASMSAAGVRSLPLTRLGRKESEDNVLGRHHRSGMTLRFRPPTDPSPLLKRRLNRANSVERSQEILQEVYFDSLFKHADSNIDLSLLYWLRSVQFEEDGDVVAVQPFKPLNFDQLGKLDLPRLFALKGFILHNTLTAVELATVLRVPIERSKLILEALFRFALIERVHPSETEITSPIDCGTERFRLNRLVVYPVAEVLRGARILY